EHLHPQIFIGGGLEIHDARLGGAEAEVVDDRELDAGGAGELPGEAGGRAGARGQGRRVAGGRPGDGPLVAGDLAAVRVVALAAVELGGLKRGLDRVPVHAAQRDRSVRVDLVDRGIQRVWVAVNRTVDGGETVVLIA